MNDARRSPTGRLVKSEPELQGFPSSRLRLASSLYADSCFLDTHICANSDARLREWRIVPTAPRVLKITIEEKKKDWLHNIRMHEWLYASSTMRIYSRSLADKFRDTHGKVEPPCTALGVPTNKPPFRKHYES